MPERILVVDDESLLAFSMQCRLEGFGYEVKTAINGVKALDVLNEFQADIVLTDIDMPEMDGLTLISHLKSHPDPPIIIAVSGKPNGEAAIQAGADAFFAKPIMPVRIKEAIEEAKAARQQSN